MKIYLQALFVWLVYSASTKYMLFKSLTWDNSLRSYLPSVILSVLFGIIFLYLFSHEDFFKFAKEVEKRESGNEKKWLKIFIHSGKVATVFLAGIITGPLLTPLMARFLLERNPFRYWVVVATCIVTSVFWLAIYKGALSFVFIKVF